MYGCTFGCGQGGGTPRMDTFNEKPQPCPHLNEGREKASTRMSVSQRAIAQTKRPKPRYVARAKVNGGWTNIGAAWDVRSGEDALSVQLNSLPIGFDGRFILLPPLEATEPAPTE